MDYGSWGQAEAQIIEKYAQKWPMGSGDTVTPVTPEDSTPWHYLIEAFLGVAVGYLEWLRRQAWKTLATREFVMAAIDKHKEQDAADDDVVIERAIKPLREAYDHLHEDIKEIKASQKTTEGDMKTVLRALGRLEGD